MEVGGLVIVEYMHIIFVPLEVSINHIMLKEEEYIQFRFEATHGKKTNRNAQLVTCLSLVLRHTCTL